MDATHQRSLVVVFALFALACGDSSPTPPINPVLVAGAPIGWGASAGTGSTFQIAVDRNEARTGSAALYLAGTSASSGTFATVAQSIAANIYRGKRLRWSGWVKHQNLTGADCGLWMRVDGPGISSAFDNMSRRSLSGSADWHSVSVVLDVAPNALGIALGVLTNCSGVLLVDDMKLDVVGTDVPVTDILTSPTVLGVDSATVASTYARLGNAPVNLDFEGVAGLSQQTVAWLTGAIVPLTTTDPAASLDDLAPLKQMIGSAHLIGLGEDTHGTREFFRMKHRVLEMAVKQMGATYFAIEATSPESDDMNRYVLTGQGDPKKLLSHLYFWTWNTQEVLDMIEWMRSWNSTAPADQRVQFLGFDMQSPGVAIDSVAAFIGRVDPARSVSLSQSYGCIAGYRNYAQVLGASTAGYAAQPATVKAACAASLQQVYDSIDAKRSAYEAASGPSVYQSILHDARLVQQFEAMASIANAGASSQSRDKSMAENIGWIRDHAPAGAKIVLWAHNAHINSVPQLMGGYLRAKYGSDYVNLGFAFGQGGFNAVGTSTGLKSWTATIVPPNAIEAAFVATGKSLALFDARQIPNGGSAASPLAGPIPMRSIGAVFDQSAETVYFGTAVLPADFDLLLFVGQTTPSTLLPFFY